MGDDPCPHNPNAPGTPRGPEGLVAALRFWFNGPTKSGELDKGAGPAGGGGVAKLWRCGKPLENTRNHANCRCPFPATSRAGRRRTRSPSRSTAFPRNPPPGAVPSPASARKTDTSGPLAAGKPVLYAATAGLCRLITHIRLQTHGDMSWHCSLATPRPISRRRPPKARFAFHDWIGNSWAVLFSHPKDFTPVCTTELGYMAKIKPEFDKRNVKVIGLCVDPVENHAKWANDIKETQGSAPNYPMIGDTDLKVVEALRHAAGRAPPATPESAPPPTIRPCATSSSSAPTRRSS